MPHCNQIPGTSGAVAAETRFNLYMDLKCHSGRTSNCIGHSLDGQPHGNSGEGPKGMSSLHMFIK